jgi:hypothetical protein
MAAGLMLRIVAPSPEFLARYNVSSQEKASQLPSEPTFHAAEYGVAELCALVLSSVTITRYAPKSGSVAVEFIGLGQYAG